MYGGTRAGLGAAPKKRYSQKSMLSMSQESETPSSQEPSLKPITSDDFARIQQTRPDEEQLRTEYIPDVIDYMKGHGWKEGEGLAAGEHPNHDIKRVDPIQISLRPQPDNRDLRAFTNPRQSRYARSAPGVGAIASDSAPDASSSNSNHQEESSQNPLEIPPPPPETDPDDELADLSQPLETDSAQQPANSSQLPESGSAIQPPDSKLASPASDSPPPKRVKADSEDVDQGPSNCFLQVDEDSVMVDASPDSTPNASPILPAQASVNSTTMVVPKAATPRSGQLNPQFPSAQLIQPGWVIPLETGENPLADQAEASAIINLGYFQHAVQYVCDRPKSEPDRSWVMFAFNNGSYRTGGGYDSNLNPFYGANAMRLELEDELGMSRDVIEVDEFGPLMVIEGDPGVRKNRGWDSRSVGGGARKWLMQIIYLKKDTLDLNSLTSPECVRIGYPYHFRFIPESELRLDRDQLSSYDSWDRNVSRGQVPIRNIDIFTWNAVVDPTYPERQHEGAEYSTTSMERWSGVVTVGPRVGWFDLIPKSTADYYLWGRYYGSEGGFEAVECAEVHRVFGYVGRNKPQSNASNLHGGSSSQASDFVFNWNDDIYNALREAVDIAYNGATNSTLSRTIRESSTNAMVPMVSQLVSHATAFGANPFRGVGGGGIAVPTDGTGFLSNDIFKYLHELATKCKTPDEMLSQFI